MITLTDSISSVELDITWGSAQTETKINDTQRTVNGTQFDYRWGFSNGYVAIVENQDVNTIKQINEWWRDNTELFITRRDYSQAFILRDAYWGVLGQDYNLLGFNPLDRDFSQAFVLGDAVFGVLGSNPLGYASVNSGGTVFISNADQPFQTMKRPYNNEADGVINLEFI